MRKLSSPAVGFLLLAILGVASAGCGQIGMLKGKMAFKDANILYQGQDYRAAAARYEDVLNQCRGSNPDCTYPDLTPAYFFLANSYDNLYRPVKRGEAANDELLTKAIANYKKSAELEQTRADIKRLALDYLVNAYGPDKLNDPSQAEPILLSMIEMDPNETSSYFGLANIYEQSGDYERAEQMLSKAREVRPNDSGVYMQLAGFYNRQGDFAKTMESLHTRAEHEPTNPEAFYTIGTYYYEKAFRDFTIPQAEKAKYVQSGLQAIDKAVALKADYFEAIVYKGLLLRVQATIEKNPAEQQKLLKDANALRDRAQAIRDKQRAGNASD